jgi:hypothetical protein
VNVHIVGGRVGAQQVVLKRGDGDAGFKQLGHNWLNLSLGQHEIAHDNRAAAHPLEAEPASQRERRLDDHSVHGHLEVAARNAVAVDIALH